MSFPISNERQFGFVIAYLIPGFLVLNGIGKISLTVTNWLALTSVPTIGGFLYAVLASLVAGLTCSTIRWLLLDSFLSWRGIVATKWEMEKLSKNIEAFDLMVAYHYRYYQFYGNMLVAIPITLSLPIWHSGIYRVDLIAVATAIELLFFLGAKDALTKYVSRSNELLEAKSKLIS